MTLYFVDGGDIPYVALSEYMPFLSGLLNDLGKGEITYEIIAEGEDDLYHFQVTRPDNGSILFVFPERDQLMFSNYNTFTLTVGSKMMVSAMYMPEVEEMTPMDLAEMLTAAASYDEEDLAMAEEVLAPEAEEGEVPMADMPAEDIEMPAELADAPASGSLFALKEGFYLNSAGDDIVLNLANYVIDLVAVDGECYVSFQTLNDLLLTDNYMQYVFDGEKVIGSAYGCSVLNRMDSAPKHEMSEAFALFNFQELCLMLDCKYGLKPEHNIDTFHNFFLNNQELFQNLVSTNPMRSSYAIANLCFTYFDDLHSGFTRSGYLFDRNQDVERIVMLSYFGPSIRKSFKLGTLYEDARRDVYRAWVPGYEEVGDTAFITFDAFTVNRMDYYDPTINFNDPQDTVDLIIYANRQIKREGSPIKNIVIDLSNNGGGNADAAIFVISWLLGEADIALRDTFTGAESNAIYLADVNLDGQYDAQDNVGEGYRLYCLTTTTPSPAATWCPRPAAAPAGSR